MATMNISLPDALKDYVEACVAEGRFSNASDFVRDLIRKEQDRNAMIREIRLALDDGEASGFSPYSRAGIVKALGLSKEQDAA